MTASELSPTEALLSCAAALTEEELTTARLALVKTGPRVLFPLDTRLLLAGDGTAGARLLGLRRGSATVETRRGVSLALRSTRISRDIEARRQLPTEGP
jgi:hypothetical protein